jgi:hypothetical protein
LEIHLPCPKVCPYTSLDTDSRIVEAYKAYLARARKAIDQGRFPQNILDRLEADMDDTLPTLKLFVPGSPMRDDLREFVCAWVVYRSDDALGYVSPSQGGGLTSGPVHHPFERNVPPDLAATDRLSLSGQPAL